MKKLSLILVVTLLLSITGCTVSQPTQQIIASTKPVYDFTSRICEDTPISVGLLINESVSCLHDYSLSVAQARKAEAAQVLVTTGAGLEEFMHDLLDHHSNVIDCSSGIALPRCTVEHDHDHQHEIDAHIWLSPVYAKSMAKNICDGLSAIYPEYEAKFRQNLASLQKDLDTLQSYGDETLASLSCRELVTFHDGFGYFAAAFNLTVAAAIEEESGSEASAKELIQLIELIQQKKIPAVFTEVNGSESAAKIICSEIDVTSYALDMGMNGDYFTIMYQNINTVKEALG